MINGQFITYHKKSVYVRNPIRGVNPLPAPKNLGAGFIALLHYGTQVIVPVVVPTLSLLVAGALS
jgi:hypothetical protein